MVGVSGAEGGKSPGYSLSLVAESTTGVLISTERTAGEGGADSSGGGAGTGGRPELPEAVGEEGAYRLLEEIRKGNNDVWFCYYCYDVKFKTNRKMNVMT